MLRNLSSDEVLQPFTFGQRISSLSPPRQLFVFICQPCSQFYWFLAQPCPFSSPEPALFDMAGSARPRDRGLPSSTCSVCCLRWSSEAHAKDSNPRRLTLV